MTERLAIDEPLCMGHGLCYGAAPHLLSDDEEGYVAERGGTVEVGDEYVAEAKAAVRACPEGAIALRAG
jgi:ferredoxin